MNRAVASMNLLLTQLLFILLVNSVNCRICYYCNGIPDCLQSKQHLKCYDPNDGCLTIISSKGVYKRGCSTPDRKEDPCKGEEVIGIWIKCYHCLDDLCNQHNFNATNSANFPKSSRILQYFPLFSVILSMIY